MKKYLFFWLLLMNSCLGKGQVNLNELTLDQWKIDLDYMVNRINKSFAGFNPELKTQFLQETQKLKANLTNLSRNQIIMEFARMLALLNDGHTELSLTGPGAHFNRFPLILYFFGHDLRIIGTTNQNTSVLGAKLIKIENHDVHDIVEKLKPYMNKDNDIEYITTAPYLMVIPEVLEAIGIVSDPLKSNFTVITDNGKEQTIDLSSVSLNSYNRTDFVRVYSKPPLCLESNAESNWFKYLAESGIMYVQYKTLYNQDHQRTVGKLTEDLWKEVDRLKPGKIVIDFRFCRGGNYNNILPFIQQIAKRPDLNVKGKLFVISGRLTFSAAAVALLYFKQQTDAILLGEISRARPNWADNMEEYDLPCSKLNFDCMDKIKTHFPELGNPDRIPIDVEIPKTFDAYRAGHDEVMDYIISRK